MKKSIFFVLTSFVLFTQMAYSSTRLDLIGEKKDRRRIYEIFPSSESQENPRTIAVPSRTREDHQPALDHRSDYPRLLGAKMVLKLLYAHHYAERSSTHTVRISPWFIASLKVAADHLLNLKKVVHPKYLDGELNVHGS